MAHRRCYGTDGVYLGIDLGTSGVKAIVVDAEQAVSASFTAPLTVSRPRPLWSEQDPRDWWQATDDAVRAVLRDVDSRAVEAVGLAGQMHGATLLADDDTVLRPAILWNDGRSARACARLVEREPRLPAITGNLAMPGFTAPKLVWVAEHEPEVFARVARVLLPKDYLRLHMTGEYLSDRSDSAGTLWLDVARRDWSDDVLAATGLTRAAMPGLVEGSEPAGTLRAEVAEAWGLRRIPVAGGAGDQAAGAIGAGVIDGSRASLSLGTSGVLFVADAEYRANPERAVHSFCHCLPDTWHRMSVILSAASCLAWAAPLLGFRGVGALLDAVEAEDTPSDVLFLPYLSGERTPHNDASAMGVFFGLHHGTTRTSLGRAVLEGVAYAFADARDVLFERDEAPDEIAVIGGGSRSGLWGRVLASVLDLELTYRAAAEVGPALGAARLARLAVTGEEPAAVATAPPTTDVVVPNGRLRDRYAEALPRYRALYTAVRDEFRRGARS